MLLDGHHQVARRTNLQLQLRRVLAALSSHPQAGRAAQSTRCRRLCTSQVRKGGQQAIDDKSWTYIDDDRKPRKDTKSLYFAEGVVGEPGQRYKASSLPLAIDSLGQRSNVIVLREFERDEDLADDGLEDIFDTLAPDNLPSNDNASATLLEDAPTASIDVLASIGELRPISLESFIEEEDFKALQHQLEAAYTRSQLKAYLDHILPSPQRGKQAKQNSTTRVSTWRVGRTHIEQRVPLPAKRGSKTKSMIIDEILRFAWSLRIYTEEHQVGEQELTLPVQYLDLLCARLDKGSESIQQWQSLLSSTLLARSIELQPHAEAGIARLVGRQHDTAQAASELAAKLASMSVVMLPRHALQSLSTKSSEELEKSLHHSNLEEIERMSTTFMSVASDGDLTITAFASGQCQHAKGLVFELLDVNAVNTHTTSVEDLHAKKSSSMSSVPVYLSRPPLHSLGLQNYSRLVSSPIQKSGTGIASASRDSYQLSKLRQPVERVDSLINTTFFPRTITEDELQIRPTYLLNSSWRAHLGLLLTDGLKPATASKLSDPTRFTTQIPFPDALLEKFSPWYPTSTYASKRGQKLNINGRWLSAVLLPAVTGSKIRLPDLRLHFPYEDVVEIGKTIDALRYGYMSSKLACHYIQMRLPEKCIDLRLEKSVTFKTWSPKLWMDDDRSAQVVDDFIQDVVTKAAHMQLDEIQSTITMDQPVGIRLPPKLFRDQGTLQDYESLDCSYVLSHFESREVMSSRPSRRAINSDSHGQLPSWRDKTKLDIMQRDSGSRRGRWRSVSIGSYNWGQNSERLIAPEQGNVSTEEKVAAMASQAEDVATSAAALIDMVTMNMAGRA